MSHPSTAAALTEVKGAAGSSVVQAIKGDDAVFTLVKDGDHRLPRPQNISRLVAAVG